MRSDLFGSYAESSCAALVVASISSFGVNHDFPAIWIALPLTFTIQFWGDQKQAKSCTVQDGPDSCRTGAATSVIFGLALGYKSVIIPIFATAVSIFVRFSLAAIYGIAVAALGMLSSIATGPAIDAYGPTSDNIAGGIAQMDGTSHRIQERTDALDTAGNTTAALGRIVALVKLLLTSFSAFCISFSAIQAAISTVDVLTPKVFIGLIVGAMLPYWFSAMTMKSVGSAALKRVEEVRRCSGDAYTPDHWNFVSWKPYLVFLLGLLFLVFRLLSDPHLILVVHGTMPSTSRMVNFKITKLCLFKLGLHEAGASDHARSLGPKESVPHKAAVICDTIGDPLKDTSGSSPIKLMVVEFLVLAPFFATQGSLLFKI
ncbi:pyrophosphate-energized vacuolar membrane proton pump-like [Musa acuminata AAA Group]|uniref:pyrophosphate-energized vacuolar membrane proton pump-like n=1 Tax=Musa acuminata AAA Group TaxID=214697 RepID=UPI0031E43381